MVEVESGHRSVLQKRLKKPGAWWAMGNTDKNHTRQEHLAKAVRGVTIISAFVSETF